VLEVGITELEYRDNVAQDDLYVGKGRGRFPWDSGSYVPRYSIDILVDVVACWCLVKLVSGVREDRTKHQ
jgi:hypothetical protein